ncbi:hypothetical protein G3T14_22030, partial [Methylobacterium sp. BTF04]|uniref:hypothetical protein n=1 Tax=Methylobacterium sp. BTF04 TaxID=2708300 RepID=UPI0013D2CD10
MSIIDLDAPNHEAKDIAPGRPVQHVEALAHVSGEELQLANNQGQFALCFARCVSACNFGSDAISMQGGSWCAAQPSFEQVEFGAAEHLPLYEELCGKVGDDGGLRAAYRG